MDITWLKDFADGWRRRSQQGRLPHAVMLAGPVGTGKRSAAAWIAREWLSLSTPPLPSHPAEKPEHPDLRWIGIPDDKKAISIDQIRELVADLALTSHSGDGKVAVIEPASAMTINAANSLLKTLEEPPGDALLVLVVDRVGRLPATIFSRCQRLEFSAPKRSEALAWLNKLRPGAAWTEALEVAGGAPVAAIEALDSLETSASMAKDLNSLGRDEQSPVDVAARWAKLETGFVLDWLARQARLVAIAQSAGRDRATGVTVDNSVLRRIDRRNLFCYLDIINRLRGQPSGSFNVQLALEGLLIDWTEGLANCGAEAPGSGINLMTAAHR